MILCNPLLQHCRSEHYTAPHTLYYPPYSPYLLLSLKSAVFSVSCHLQSHAPQAQSSSACHTLPFSVLCYLTQTYPTPPQPHPTLGFDTVLYLREIIYYSHPSTEGGRGHPSVENATELICFNKSLILTKTTHHKRPPSPPDTIFENLIRSIHIFLQSWSSQLNFAPPG